MIIGGKMSSQSLLRSRRIIDLEESAGNQSVTTNWTNDPLDTVDQSKITI